jgi:hypothetical protein
MRRRELLALPLLPEPDARMVPLDYGRSFLSGVAPWNRVRFWVESRTRIIRTSTGQAEEFLQCAACKSEDTFAAANLFKEDNYDFLPVFGPRFGVIFRRKASAQPGYKEVRESTRMWDGQSLRMVTARSSRLLESPSAIRKATHAGLPLVAQIQIENPETGLRAILEFPVKTMNIHDGKDMYQADTGPLAFPDLSWNWSRLADSLSLAYAAFNASHFADFVIEDATPIPQPAGNTALVYHYSKRLSLKSANRLYSA